MCICAVVLAVVMDALDAAMDAAVDVHEQWRASGHAEGFAAGATRGSLQGHALGRTKGRELAIEAGFMRGACDAVAKRLPTMGPERKVARLRATLEQVQEAFDAIDWHDPSKPEFSDAMDQLRTKYKQLCAQAGMGAADDEAATLDF